MIVPFPVEFGVDLEARHDFGDQQAHTLHLERRRARRTDRDSKPRRRIGGSSGSGADLPLPRRPRLLRNARLRLRGPSRRAHLLVLSLSASHLFPAPPLHSPPPPPPLVGALQFLTRPACPQGVLRTPDSAEPGPPLLRRPSPLALAPLAHRHVGKLLSPAANDYDL